MNLWPYIAVLVAIAAIVLSRRLQDAWARVLLPIASTVIFVACWQVICEALRYSIANADGSIRVIERFPTPLDVFLGTKDLFLDGVILKYTIASLYRVACGFGLACALGIPLGLWIGWSTRAMWAINPLVQAMRPISPIAWIPLAILWFGIKDASAIFLIFVASFFPIVTGTMTAVRTIPTVYVRSAQNFGLRGLELVRRVVLPAALPQIIISLRIALGIAWLVIVAAEMIAVESGLGFLIMDARNGNYYDRVVGAMICIGVLGVVLDFGMRRLERFDEVRWGFPKETELARNEQVRTVLGGRLGG